MTSEQNIQSHDILFIDNLAIKGREDQFMTMDVDMQKILQSWKDSLFSFEWMDNNGKIKDFSDLPPKEQVKRQEVEELLGDGQRLSRPVLGLGLNDNIEIGSGRAVLLTLAHKGQTHISVHIPKSSLEDIQSLLK